MKLIIEENEQKMSESAMHILLGAMMQDKRVNISLTAGRSPINLYKMMVPYVKDQEKFKDIQYYLFDEAPYQDKPYGPNWEEMQELFFKDANIPCLLYTSHSTLFHFIFISTRNTSKIT